MSSKIFTRYLEFDESLFTLDWRLHLSINEYVSYTAVKRTKFFSLSNDIRICIYDGLPASYGQRKSRLMVEKAEKLVFLHRKVGEITNET